MHLVMFLVENRNRNLNGYRISLQFLNLKLNEH